MFNKKIDLGIKVQFIGLDNSGKSLLINKAGGIKLPV